MRVPIACICDPLEDGSQRHPAGDVVVLKDMLGFDDAIACRTALRLRAQELGGTIDGPDIMGVLSVWYVLLAPTEWTVQDAKGKPVPLTRETIRDRLLTRPDIAYLVADAADELYSKATVVPLLQAGSTTSLDTSEDASTPQTTPGSTPPTPEQSKRSLTTTTQTGGTGPTSKSRGGDSKSSLRSVSAA